MKRAIDGTFIAALVITVAACTGHEARHGNTATSNETTDLEKLPAGPPNGKPEPGAPVKRGSLDISVKDADETLKKLDDLMKTFGVYVESRRSVAAGPGVDLPPGVVREITMTLKAASTGFDRFLAGVRELGTPLHEEMRTEDVTYAFMDIKARMANQRNTEQRLLGYLNDPGRTTMTAAEVERELAAVRGKIERLNARLRFMENQIAYSTLVLRISVRPEGMPAAGDSLLRRFENAMPWLAGEAVVLVLFFLGINLWRRRRQGSPAG